MQKESSGALLLQFCAVLMKDGRRERQRESKEEGKNVKEKMSEELRESIEVKQRKEKCEAK